MPVSNDDYALLDSGDGQKLERFGPYVLARPCSQAVWKPALSEAAWAQAHATFDRAEGHQWHNRGALPAEWRINTAGIMFKLSGTDFGHLGLFPEQRAQWEWIRKVICAACATRRRPVQVLNLFAYSGGSTLAAALGGAEVCHLDASKGMVQWARDNAALNSLQNHPVRWITDDAHKFLCREARRERRYDAVILDPPTFGRGQNNEMYKIEKDLPETLRLCRELLQDEPLFLLLSAHTPGYSSIVLQNVLGQAVNGLGGATASGEMLLTGAPEVLPAPCGAYARWVCADGER
ncbi:MAG: class I SAM-dependent methyltransferase [bacterium]